MATSRGFRIFPRAHLNAGKRFLHCQQRRRIHNTETLMREENISLNRRQIFEESQLRMMKEVLENNTEITRDHLTPELRLHLLTPNCHLYNAPVTNDTEGNDDLSSLENLEKRIFRDPFWSIYWPGGQALTRFILDYGRELLNKSKKRTSFLDLGCGCGASAIAAKMIGASRVVANDIDQGIWLVSVACVAAKLNANLNNVDIMISSENLLENRDSPYELTADVILVGDLLYDEETAEALIPWLEKASLRNGSRIYLGDPGRHALTEGLKSRMKLQRTYSLPENVRRENYGYNTASVWQFKTG